MNDTDHILALGNALRLKALNHSGLMDSLPEDSFDRVTRIASQILGVPVSLLSMVDDRRQFFKSSKLPSHLAHIRETPLSHSFCQHVVTGRAPLVVDDATKHTIVRNNLAIKELGVRAYLGVPVFAPMGEALGSLCAIDTIPRAWEEHDVEIMNDLAQVVMAEIKLRDEINLRTENEKRLQLMASEMSHRIKNIYSLTSGLIAISAQDDVTRAFAHKIGQRLQSLANAQEYVHVSGIRAASTTLTRLLHVLTQIFSPSAITIADNAESVGETAAIAFGLVMHELGTNAVKYGALSVPKGRVHIDLVREKDDLVLRWIEIGGPKLAGEPANKGFGRSMIGRSLKVYIDGEVEYDWAPGGLDLKMRIPVERLKA